MTAAPTRARSCLAVVHLRAEDHGLAAQPLL